MSIIDAPDIRGKIVRTRVFNPAVPADTDIQLDDYDPHFNREEINPILAIDVLDFDTAGPSFQTKKYRVNNRGTPGSLAAGEFGIVDDQTFRLGDTLQNAGHYFIIDVTYIAGRIKNT